MANKPMYVTQPTLATLDEYVEILRGVWDRRILTHNGPLVQQLESELMTKLGVPHFTVVSNGTVALQMALKALELKGEIITTPFTWIATVSAIKWEGCSPVFCDIDADTLNMDVTKIEERITPNTVAIMPVHVFGNPCDMETIERIAENYDLKVIYDAAHAIGSTYKGRSILEYGDISATSLHATKLLNTAEGGACITTDKALDEKLKRIRFFGHNVSKDVVEDGFNGKLTEIHAALGLANLKYYDAVIEDRIKKYFLYLNLLQELECVSFQTTKFGESNFSYFPIVFGSEQRLLATERALNNANIFPRRYFYPSVNTYEKVVTYQHMPVSESISKRILCLPLYYGLSEAEVYKVAQIVTSVNKDKVFA